MKSLNRNVVLVSLAFFLCWLGFDGAQQYFVPILHDQGRGGEAFRILILIYAAYLVSNVFAPSILSQIGLKVGMLLGMFPYGLFLLFVPTASTQGLYALAVAVGIGAISNCSPTLLSLWGWR